jgi:hypothetical protein
VDDVNSTLIAFSVDFIFTFVLIIALSSCIPERTKASLGAERVGVLGLLAGVKLRLRLFALVFSEAVRLNWIALSIYFRYTGP